MKTALTLLGAVCLAGCRSPSSGPPAVQALEKQDSPPTATTGAPKPPPPPEPKAPPGMALVAGGELSVRGYRGRWRIPDFAYDILETTVAEYNVCVDTGPCRPARTSSFRKPGCTGDGSRGPDVPITCIDWAQAQDYCVFVGKRLPTVEEWQWAMQGGEQQRKYPWGDAPIDCTRGNIAADPLGCGFEGPSPVGHAPAGATRDGLLDMVGNVAESTSSSTHEQHEPGRKDFFGSGYDAGRSWKTSPGSYENPHWLSLGAFEGWSGKVGVRCAIDGPSGHGPYQIRPLPGPASGSPMAAIVGGVITMHQPPRGAWTIPDFSYDIHEATVADYRRCVDAGACRPAAKANRKRPRCTGDGARGEDVPINCITRPQAGAYCAFAGKRLPTIEEWTWVVADDKKHERFPWGNAPIDCTRSNQRSEPPGCGFDGPWPVGTATAGANAYGQLDLLGNLMEWTASDNRFFERKPGEPVIFGTEYLAGYSWNDPPTADDQERAIASTMWDTVSEEIGVRCARDGIARHGPLRMSTRRGETDE